jgi:hypothetical protein
MLHLLQTPQMGRHRRTSLEYPEEKLEHHMLNKHLFEQYQVIMKNHCSMFLTCCILGMQCIAGFFLCISLLLVNFCENISWFSFNINKIWSLLLSPVSSLMFLPIAVIQEERWGRGWLDFGGSFPEK